MVSLGENKKYNYRELSLVYSSCPFPTYSQQASRLAERSGPKGDGAAARPGSGSRPRSPSLSDTVQRNLSEPQGPHLQNADGNACLLGGSCWLPGPAMAWRLARECAQCLSRPLLRRYDSTQSASTFSRETRRKCSTPLINTAPVSCLSVVGTSARGVLQCRGEECLGPSQREQGCCWSPLGDRTL